MEVERAPDVQQKVESILEALNLEYVNQFRIICMRSKGCTARAYARIWNLPDIWQKALDVRAYYIIEVLSQHYDKLSEEEKEKVIIHELLHIPKTFSGALVPHLCFGKRINERRVEELYRKYREKLGKKPGD
ncbi:MAG: putative metallopeptidase [Candidatus Micrarchaeota archaeon]